MPLHSLSPIPLKNVEFRDGMGLRLGNGISFVSSLFWEVEYDRPSLNPFCFSEKSFCFLLSMFSFHHPCFLCWGMQTIYCPMNNMHEVDLVLKTCLLHWHNAIEYNMVYDYQLSDLLANWQWFPTASEQCCIYCHSYTFPGHLTPVMWERSSCE